MGGEKEGSVSNLKISINFQGWIESEQRQEDMHFR